METLRLVSFNYRGLPCANNSLYKRPSVQLLLDDTKNDIICVQETWYTKDLQHLNDVIRIFMALVFPLLLPESLHDSRSMPGAGSSSGVELFQVFMSTG